MRGSPPACCRKCRHRTHTTTSTTARRPAAWVRCLRARWPAWPPLQPTSEWAALQVWQVGARRRPRWQQVARGRWLSSTRPAAATPCPLCCTRCQTACLMDAASELPGARRAWWVLAGGVQTLNAVCCEAYGLGQRVCGDRGRCDAAGTTMQCRQAPEAACEAWGLMARWQVDRVGCSLWLQGSMSLLRCG